MVTLNWGYKLHKGEAFSPAIVIFIFQTTFQ